MASDARVDADGSRPPFLSVRGLRKSYGAAVVLDGVDFDVPEGRTTGLIGPNGAGKTTVFNMIAGFDRPDGGEIKLAGAPIDALSTQARTSRGISRTFQEIRLFGGLSALDNVAVGLRTNAGEALGTALVRWGATRSAERAARAEAEALLDLVGLSGFGERKPGELSYGQQKRVGIARALATGRRLLCLDEPAAGLDAATADSLMELIGTLNDAVGTILLIEHNLDFVRAVCSQVLFLDVGRVLTAGTADEVFADERVWRAFAGV